MDGQRTLTGMIGLGRIRWIGIKGDVGCLDMARERFHIRCRLRARWCWNHKMETIPGDGMKVPACDRCMEFNEYRYWLDRKREDMCCVYGMGRGLRVGVVNWSAGV